MKYCRHSFRIFLIFSLFFIFCGFSNAALTDIQSAMIEQDYEKVRQLSESFINGGSGAQQKNQARYYLGISQLYLEKYKEAQVQFEYLIEHEPDVALRDQAYLGLIDAFFLQGDYKKSSKFCDRMLKLNSRSDFLSLLYLKKARADFKLAEWDNAKDYLDKIISYFPDSPEAPIARQFLEEKHYFAVQLGAFLDQERSLALVSELKKKGEYAYIVETVDSQGRKFYRVRIGKLAFLKEAEELQTRLSKLGYPTQIYP